MRRCQFALGPSFLESQPGWQRVHVGDLRLSAHPDLPVRQVAAAGCRLTSLGILLDPSQPARTDEAILAGLLGELAAGQPFSDWVRQTYRLAGRWILMVDDGQTCRVLADAMGLRQACYTTGPGSPVWCATDPGLIAGELGLTFDAETRAAFLDTPAYRNADQPLWPGDTTPYREIRRLLANHVLDMRRGEARRYWPDGPVGRLDLDAGAEQAARILRGVMAAAVLRGALCFGLSAGWDSRVLLAACRPWVDGIYFYSYTYSRPNIDPVVAGHLLASLGLPHHAVPVPEQPDRPFLDCFERHVTLARPYVGRFVQAMYDALPPGRLNITGNAAEIVRTRFRLPPGQSLTAQWLSGWTTFQREDGFEGMPFVVEAWQRWLDGVGECHDLDVLDLFYWEHFAGNFAGADQTDVDFAVDTLTPYSCRDLLTTMLAVPERSRDHDYPELYVEIIRRCWPELLDFPINPARATVFREDGSVKLQRPTLGRRLRSRALDALVATGLYAPLRRMRRGPGSR